MKGVQGKMKRIGMGIGEEGAMMLSEALKTNSALTELNLGSDEMKPMEQTEANIIMQVIE